MKGLLIAFEGIDCCGKETQAKRVWQWLIEKAGQSAVLASGPTDDWSPIGEHIRSILQKKTPFPGNFELQRLFVIDRAQDLFCRIVPQIEAGVICLRERYALSTIAYGMLLEGRAADFIRLHWEIIGPLMIWPNLTIVLDISADEAMRRQSERDGKPKAELFEKREFLEKVRANYLVLAKPGHFVDYRDDCHGQIIVVNGERPPDEVFAEIRNFIMWRLPQIFKPSTQTTEVSDASR